MPHRFWKRNGAKVTTCGDVRTLLIKLHGRMELDIHSGHDAHRMVSDDLMTLRFCDAYRRIFSGSALDQSCRPMKSTYPLGSAGQALR